MTTKKAVVFIIIFTMLTAAFWNTGIATANEEPNVTLYISEAGDKSSGGKIFKQTGDLAETLLPPGASETGTLRIVNNYSDKISVNNLGLSINLKKISGENYESVTDNSLIEQYAKDMKLTVKKGRLLIFSDTIYDKSFYEMLYEPNSEKKGHDLSLLDKFDIGKNESVDLEYTVMMDEQAGNDIQGITASVNFLVNVSQNPEPITPTYSGGGVSYYVPPAAPEEKPKEEVKDPAPDIANHWAHDCIVALYNKGIIKPDSDGKFRPDKKINRAEVAVLVGKARGLKPKFKFTTGYKDSVPIWARGYVIADSEKGIFRGYEDNTFRASRGISREEMTAVLVRAFNKKSTGPETKIFSDKDQIGTWAKLYVKHGVQNRVIEGYPDNTFRPKNNITRAEAYNMICKLLNYHNEHSKQEVNVVEEK